MHRPSPAPNVPRTLITLILVLIIRTVHGLGADATFSISSWLQTRQLENYDWGADVAFSSFPWPQTRQFQHWYPEWHGDYMAASQGPCNQTLAEYNTFFNAVPGSTASKRLLNACYAHESCVLDNLPTARVVNLQAAAVIGGIMPTLFAVIGPSVAEISLLSTHRPLLSFLISLGAPSVLVTRIFEYSDPAAVLTQSRYQLRIPSQRLRYAIPLSIAQYALVLGCIANIVLTGIDIGRMSILSWGCTTTFTPLLWSLLASVVHIVAAASFTVPRLFAKGSKEKQDKQPTVRDIEQGSARAVPPSKLSSATRRFLAFLASLAQLCKREVTPCANQSFEPQMVFDEQVPRVAVVLNVLAGAFGYIHVTFGILVFASLQFVGVRDMTNLIMSRYIASSALARLVLVFELAGLRNIAQEAQEV